MPAQLRKSRRDGGTLHDGSAFEAEMGNGMPPFPEAQIKVEMEILKMKRLLPATVLALAVGLAALPAAAQTGSSSGGGGGTSGGGGGTSTGASPSTGGSPAADSTGGSPSPGGTQSRG